MSTQNLKVSRGEVVAFTTGEYSEYGVVGYLVLQQTINTVYFPSESTYRAAIGKIGVERFEMYCKGV